MAPSITPPSMSPTLSSSPTETCFSIDINVLSDDYPNESQWAISTFATVDGIQGKNLVYDSSSQIELQVDAKLYNATHIENSQTETSVNGVLCDCGDGTSLCECQGEVCIIERGHNLFYEKVVNCKDAGGVAAIIYNNVGDDVSFWTLGEGFSASIPAAFISQTDGKYLVEHGLGEVVAMSAYSSLPLQFNDNTLISRRICLPEGNYEFTIYDSYGDGILLPGHYNITTSNGALIVEGGESEWEGITRFSLPFVPSPSAVPSISQIPSASLPPSMSRPPSVAPSITPPSASPSRSTSPTMTAAPSTQNSIKWPTWHPMTWPTWPPTAGTTTQTRSPSSGSSAKMTPMPTQIVSSSIAPTTCYLIEVVIIYDWAPIQSSWTLQRISAFGSSALVKTYEEASWIARSYTESMCLPAGEYEFTIYDAAGDGICCDWGDGHYNVTTSNGTLIAHGGAFESEETTRFSLPIVPS